MVVDFYKHKKGDIVRVHCCNECARAAGVQPKYPPDSGCESWLCEVCKHRGIGSVTDCVIGDWLTLRPTPVSVPNKPTPAQQRRLDEFDDAERILRERLKELHERRRKYINSNQLNEIVGEK